MTFLHPALLYLLPLAAIPVVLHLLMLHRLKTVELSTFRFLFDSYVQQRRRMKFVEALLAALRALFLLLLVLAVCRPVVKHWGELFRAGSGRDVLLLVDCSASMAARTAGVPAFERAKAAALSVVEHLTPGDRLTLVRVTSRPEEVFSQFSADAQAVRDRIDSLALSPSRGNMYAAFTHVFGPSAQSRANPVVYVFTDCQNTGWDEVRNQGLGQTLPAEAQVVVVNVGSREAVPNLAVVGEAPRRRQAIAGLPIILRPRVVNYSKGEPAEVAVGLFINEKEITRTTMTLNPGETATRGLIYVPTEPGDHRCRFEVSGKGPDRFPEDNKYRFTLHVVPRVKVLLVNGSAGADPFDSEALYLHAALTAGAEVGVKDKVAARELAGPGPGGKDFVRSLDVQEVPEGGLNPETLRDAQVVILANCGGLNATHFGWLHGFVAGGGGLLIFPGDRVNPDVYNNQLFAAPGPQRDVLMPVRLAPAQGDPDKPGTFQRLAVIDFAHPVLSVFDDPEAHYLKAVRFYRRFPLSRAEGHERAWPLAQFAGGGPALVENRLGDGVVVLAAFPANARWSNLPLKPEFVPLVLRLVSHLQQRSDVEGASVVAADGVAEVTVARSWAPAGGKVTDPAGRSSLLTFEPSGSRMVAAVERTDQSGYYSVEVKGSRTDQPRAGVLTFAVNLAPEESDFTTVGEEQLREWFPGARLSVVDASAEAQQAYGGIGNDREVWRPLVWVLFGVIGLEFLLATLGGQPAGRGEPVTVAERVRRLSPRSWVGRMTGAARTQVAE
jgi:hypothetical protein